MTSEKYITTQKRDRMDVLRNSYHSDPVLSQELIA